MIRRRAALSHYHMTPSLSEIDVCDARMGNAEVDCDELLLLLGVKSADDYRDVSLGQFGRTFLEPKGQFIRFRLTACAVLALLVVHSRFSGRLFDLSASR